MKKYNNTGIINHDSYDAEFYYINIKESDTTSYYIFVRKSKANDKFLRDLYNKVVVKDSNITPKIIIKSSKIVINFVTILEGTQILEHFGHIDKVYVNDKINLTFNKEIPQKYDTIDDLLVMVKTS
jgi:hypothetical protein